MLTPTLRLPGDLVNKLLREEHRAIHAVHPAHLADHLYNFCVTALAVRDHLFVSLRMDAAAKEAFHGLWAAEPARVACREIANTMKHAVLRAAPQTKAAAESYSTVVNVYRSKEGKLVTLKERTPDIFVLLSDGTTLNVLELTNAVTSFWKEYFASHDVEYHEQTEAEYFGIATHESAS